MPLTYDTPPATKPLDLDELKDHLRIGSSTAYDDYLNLCIEALAEELDVNNMLQWAFKRQLIEATIVFTLSDFKRKLELPRPPLQSVSSVEYRDKDGTWQTVATDNYEVNSDADPGFIRFSDDYSFPALLGDEEYPVRITYVAGYSDSEGNSTHLQVPANIRLWGMNVIGDLWQNRKTQIVARSSAEVVQLVQQMGRLKAPHNAGRRFG
ncbi:MAG: hypothetical protein CL666_14685 [Balneola sp.]|nr:hypothetical protein [Balneola sp.]|tara:strand:+ start:6450 stop:7076 length:627 start_codon:yes stop_codon:yes gene_type:complete